MWLPSRWYSITSQVLFPPRWYSTTSQVLLPPRRYSITSQVLLPPRRDSTTSQVLLLRGVTVESSKTESNSDNQSSPNDAVSNLFSKTWNCVSLMITELYKIGKFLFRECGYCSLSLSLSLHPPPPPLPSLVALSLSCYEVLKVTIQDLKNVKQETQH